MVILDHCSTFPLTGFLWSDFFSNRRVGFFVTRVAVGMRQFNIRGFTAAAFPSGVCMVIYNGLETRRFLDLKLPGAAEKGARQEAG